MTKLRFCIISILINCIVISSIGCDEEEKLIPVCTDLSKLVLPNGYKKNHLRSLIFLDYTDPKIMGPTARLRLHRMIEKLLISRHDSIDIYFITANTVADQSTPRLSFSLDIDECKPFIPNATLDSVSKCRLYACNRLQALESYQAQLDKLLDEQNSPGNPVGFDRSDIASFLYIANKQFENVKGPNVLKNIYIISDMEQNCPGYFGLNTLFVSNRNVATGDVENDLQIISSHIDVSNFRGVNISYIKGDMPPKQRFSSAENTVVKYWETLFTRLDMNYIPWR